MMSPPLIGAARPFTLFPVHSGFDIKIQIKKKD